MKCPYCMEQMEKGYIEQTDVFRPLQWSPANRGTGFFVSTKRNIKLTASLKGGTVTVYRCAQCRKLIMDENEIDA